MFGKRQEIVGLWFEILKGISFNVFSFFRKPMPLAAKETWLFGRLDLSPLIIISLHLMNVVLPFLFNFPTYIYICVHVIIWRVPKVGLPPNHPFFIETIQLLGIPDLWKPSFLSPNDKG
jgi:hypothetical protein